MTRPAQNSCRSVSPKGTSIGVFSRNGFSMIELMMVVSIVAILSLLILPALQRSREKARGSVCLSNMRQMAVAMFNYASDKEDDLPWASRADRNGRGDWVWGGPGGISFKNPSDWLKPGFAYHAESGSIFPYLIGQPRQEVMNDADPRSWRSYRCPSSDALGAALRVNYALNSRLDPELRYTAAQVNNDDDVVNFRLGSVVSASEKVMMVDKAPLTMSSAMFTPSASFNRPTDMVQVHNETANYSFFDGSIHPIPGNLMIEVMKAKNLTDRYFDLSRP